MPQIFKTQMERVLENLDLAPAGTSNTLILQRIVTPSYEVYRDLHNRVGEPYGWNTRERINNQNEMTKLLTSHGVELWRFFNNEELIGYALLTCADDKTVELEDFGLFPEFCCQGYGLFFLLKILEHMKSLGMKKVWLTTRSTNHPKVVPFYQRAGFLITGYTQIS